MIHRIPSADDPRLESYRHVGDPAWIRSEDLFVAEGRLVVERLIDLEQFAIESVLVNRAAHDALFERLSALETSVYVCDDPTLASITGFKFHRGCLALVARPAPRSPDQLLTAGRLLALEGVGNPDNVGGLFRTAAAFGVDGILLNHSSGDPLYRKAIRTSMGASLRVPFARVDDPRWLDVLDRFRQKGFKVVALTPSAEAEPVAQFTRQARHDDRFVVLVGAEGPGLGDATLERADVRVRIPIESVVDSLNVVVAAGIALHAITPAARRFSGAS
jgi:tRNA G18 (ribose-2'-O)-methylase SpoU